MSLKFRRLLARGLMILTVAALAMPSAAFAQTAKLSDEDAKLRDQIVKKGLDYLEQHGQEDDGTFTPRAGAGLTALAVTAMLRNGLPPDHPAVAKGLKAMEGFVQPNGGIYGGGRLMNYETCVAMLAFAEANQNGRYNEILKRGKAFLVGNQYGGGSKRAESDPWYGGVGYGEGGRPDLSNTGYLIEALKAADAGPDDPAIQRALLFVSRCQNTDSKQNDTQFGDLVKDGGFYYEIPLKKIDPKEAPERLTENGGLRSYGSMTYTGFKSMIYAGLTENDPRVKAAVDWITKHYATDSNPGMGSAGLYYYYHTFGAGLNAAGIDELTDADGKKHNWRSEVIRELAARQQPDGSWANDNRRWFENDKNLATSFALMALSYCQDSPQAAP